MTCRSVIPQLTLNWKDYPEICGQLPSIFLELIVESSCHVTWSEINTPPAFPKPTPTIVCSWNIDFTFKKGEAIHDPHQAYDWEVKSHKDKWKLKNGHWNKLEAGYVALLPPPDVYAKNSTTIKSRLLNARALSWLIRSENGSWVGLNKYLLSSCSILESLLIYFCLFFPGCSAQI